MRSYSNFLTIHWVTNALFALARPQVSLSGSVSSGPIHITAQRTNSTLTDDQVYARAMAKHGISVESTMSKRVDITERDSYDSATLSSGEYLLTLDVGGQSPQVIFDTGSNPLWFMNWSPPADGYSATGETIDAKYTGGGEAISTVYKGSVSLGDLTVDQQAFGSYTSGSVVFPGVLGMGSRANFATTINNGPSLEPTFFANIEPQLSAYQFIVSLYTADQGGTGDIWFGQIPDGLGAAPQYTQINGGVPGWAISISGYAVGDGASTTGLSPSCPNWAADTGTTASYFDITLVQNYFSQVSGSVNPNGDGVQWRYPCGSNLPDLTLQTSDGLSIFFYGEYFAGNPVGNGMCGSPLRGQDPSLTTCIMGQALFHSNNVIFDIGHSLLGFIQKGP